jgi:microcystin-dependent protein
MFAGNFAPNGWAFCSGQTLPIAQNTVLFDLIGTTYGGDGQNTYNLPDLRGRRGVHQGQLSEPYTIGGSAGAETTTLITAQMASHSHAALATAESGSVASPAANTWAQWSDNPYAPLSGTEVDMAPSAIGVVGGSQPHENRSPYLVISYIISLFGIFPSQQ